MDTPSTGYVEVARRIEAPAATIFAVLADPSRHTDIDGSGMLRGSTSSDPVVKVGDVFEMKMFYEQFGDYVMANHVVEYDVDRRIAWEPERIDVRDDGMWHHRWGFELSPDGATATTVTEFYDCTRAPDEGRAAVRNGEAWVKAMAATLELLHRIVTS